MATAMDFSSEEGMSVMRIAISSGHGKYIRGARGNPVPPQVDEVDEARRIVERVASYLDQADIEWVDTFHDDTSHDQGTNLTTICNWHNRQDRELDVSVHLNCYDHSAHGVEVLYVTQDKLAAEVSEAISVAGGFTNRGAKYRSDLKFLNSTEEPAILLECFFCDHTGDCNLYHQHFDNICRAIASSIMGQPIQPPIEPPIEEVPPKPDLETPTVRIETTGAVNVYVNGVLVTTPDVLWHDDITATVFAGDDDPQDSAYGSGHIDGDQPGVAVPFKWRDKPRPDIIVSGPKGEQRCPVVDVGPWNIDDPNYVNGTARPLAELQYDRDTEAQNGMVPTNDAGIDLTPATAAAVGVSGKGKVKWRFA